MSGTTRMSASQDRSARPTNPKVSLVIPARNEARNLEAILPELPQVHEVILVDGHSVDGTVKAAQSVMPSIRVFHQVRRGKGNALARGFDAVTGDVVVMFDADGSADPAELPRFVEALVAGADFAKGSRFCAGGGSADITPFRKVGNRFLNTVTNTMIGVKFSDLCYGYNAFWVDVLGVLELPDPYFIAPADVSMPWGDGFEIETIINCRIAAAGFKITEVPSYERPRIYGASNLNAVTDGLRVLKTINAERRRARTECATIVETDVAMIPREMISDVA